jgi:prephenate dehydrogenase
MTKHKAAFHHVTIIGVGLLGGSIGLALKRAFPDMRVAGVGRSPDSLAKALDCGAIDSSHLSADVPAAHSDLVILATPVRSFTRYLHVIAPVLPRGAVVTDVGSTKASVVRAAERVLGRGGPFIGSHPMAGSEQKGVAYARPDLFKDAVCILTPTIHTLPAAIRKVRLLWNTLGMRIVEMPPAVHDRAVARISHLPHILSALLMLLPGEADLDVAARGFAEMTRLAGGDVEMWRDILLTNSKAILHTIDRFEEKLARLRDLVETGDEKRIAAFLAMAKKRRDEFLWNNGKKGRSRAR